MGIATLWASVWTGAKRRWKTGIAFALTSLGAVWLLTEVGMKVSPALDGWLDANRNLYLFVAAAAALAGFLASVYEPRRVSFCIPTTHTELTLKFGDLFEEKDDWLIGVNEFFDSSLGDIVLPTSVHGQLIVRHFGSDEARFRASVDTALQAYPSTQAQRPSGATVKYDLGATAVLAKGSGHIFLVAISRTDPATNKAKSTVAELWDALQQALHMVHLRGNGQPLALPLMGNGRASINLPPQHLLRLVVLGIVDVARRYHLPRSVTLVLAEDCFSSIDLREIRRDWKGEV